ncbi:hypothetical protein PUN28_012854 [Cardiocondyla obscurior]|uniref:Uncharacterized protein n=1 Tax=Cardiocondyla obscurior TaxID=286306 RepID=A0AAW2F5C9_9HYME
MIVRGGVVTGVAVVVADLLAELVMGRAHGFGAAGVRRLGARRPPPPPPPPEPVTERPPPPPPPPPPSPSL